MIDALAFWNWIGPDLIAEIVVSTGAGALTWILSNRSYPICDICTKKKIAWVER
jgi:hypothetical protein